MENFVMDHDLLGTLRIALEDQLDRLEKMVDGEYSRFKFYSHEIMNIELLLQHFGSPEVVGNAIHATEQQSYCCEYGK